MAKFTIDKQFSFCYGHRVYVQKLNNEYTGDDCAAKCRHLHGHEGLVHVFLETDILNDQSMVTDFKHLGWLKKFLDDVVDHKFIIDYNDPMFRQLVINVHAKMINDHRIYYDTVDEFIDRMTIPVCVPNTTHIVGNKVNMTGLDSGTSEFEILEGYLIVDFVPTSENLSKWLWNIVNVKMRKLGVKCSQIDWFETPKSRSSYTPYER